MNQSNNSLPFPLLENLLVDIIAAWISPPSTLLSIPLSECDRDFETATERIIGGLESHKLMSPEIRRVIGASNVSNEFSVHPSPFPELNFSIYTAPHVAYVIICSDRLNNSIYSYQPPSIPLSLPRGWSRCGGLEP